MKDYTALIDELRQYAADRKGDISDLTRNAAAAITDLTVTLSDCRNELCLKCGTYRYRHEGACDGCRWKT